MALKIIVSPNHDVASRYMMNEMKEEMLADPLGKPIFYIVPEQMTFQQEYTLFKDDALKGSIRTQVVSFSRLAFRVLQETGGSTKQFISSIGTQMMLRKIVDQRKEPFQIFQKATDKYGFMEQLERFITELKRHEISPALLQEQIHYANENIPLKHKLADLHYIYDALTEQLEHKYIDGEDQLQLLIEKVKDTSFLQGTTFYIDGFYRFTPQELSVIEQLLTYGESVTVALIAEEAEFKAPLDELDTFYQTKETYGALKEMAKEINVPIENNVYLERDALAAEPLQHLHHYYATYELPPYEKKVDQHILLSEAVHPRAEIEGVIQQIFHLVRDRGYRYNDIVIYVRETETYYDLIQTLFHAYRIPVFIDEKKTMLNHPLIEFIRSLFDVISSNWRYEAIFRLLKTGYVPTHDRDYPLTVDAIDELENYVLEFGVRSKKQWFEDHWIYQRFRGFYTAIKKDDEKQKEARINAYRKQVVAALQQFDETIRQATTVSERCEVTFQLLEQLNIPNQLEQMRQTYEQAGKLEQAREEEQVWKAVLNLFDELVEMIGDEKLSFHDFRNIFEAGLEALEFSHVPPSLDHVIVGTIDQSRIMNKKCAFLIGVNEGAWPLKPPVDGMINEQEREYLEQFGLRLAASSKRVLLDDYFYMYLAFTLPTEFLSVSYVLSDAEGSGKIPSQMIDRLQKLYPTLKQPLLLQDPDELTDSERFITTEQQTRGPLAIQLARYLRGYKMKRYWWDVLAWYFKNENKYETTYRMLQSLFYENKPVALTKKTVEKLIPDKVKTSVSRIEMLYECSYKHFLAHHLQVEKRRSYSLEAPDIGQLFHEALKHITDWVMKEGKDFADLNKNDARSYAEKAVNNLSPILQHQILTSSNRFRYIKRKLEKVIAQATYILSEQSRVSGFSPVGIELDFGFHDSRLQPVRIPLANDRELILRGRIDRVDKGEYDDQLYLRIIDYKSSARTIALEEVYYGLTLQMLAYLDVVLSQANSWLGMKASPAGILYFHIHDPILKDAQGMKEEKIEKEIFKQFKMDGVIAKNNDVAILMDEQLASGGRSDVVPIGIKNDGTFYKSAKLLDEATFQTLRNYVHHLLEKAGVEITSGQINLDPYENKRGNACRFCDFRSICQFDPTLVENNYRRLTPLKQDEVLEKIASLTEQNSK